MEKIRVPGLYLIIFLFGYILGGGVTACNLDPLIQILERTHVTQPEP